MASCNDYLAVTLVGWIYALMYFFRGSISPITDVLQAEFNATSSEIGLMSSMFWFFYFTLQIPLGMLLQRIKAETILFFSSFLFGVTCFLFGAVESHSIVLPSVLMLLSGIWAAPIYLCFASLVATRFSNGHLAFFGGIVYALNALILVSGNMFQAYLYQQFGIWRQIYWVLAAMAFVVSILMAMSNFDRILGRSVSWIMPRYAKTSRVETIEETTSTQTEDLENMVDFHHGDTTVNTVIAVDTAADDEDNDNEVDNQSKDITSVWTKLKLVVKDPHTWNLSIHQFCVNIIQYVFIGLWGINYMRLKYDIDRQTSTMIAGFFWISYAVGTIVIGKICATYTNRKNPFYFTMFFVFVPSMIVIYGNANVPLFVIILCYVLTGIGMGITSITFVVVREYNDERGTSDIAVGFCQTVSISVIFLMQYLIGVLMDFHWEQRGNGMMDVDGGRIYSVSDYNFGLLVVPIVCAIGIISSILVKETNGKSVQWDK